MKRGDVVRVQLPRPAGRSGREQFGTRPAIIVQDDPTFASLETTVVVPCTTNMNATRFSNTLNLWPSRTNGLTADSVALVPQMRAIDRKRIEAVLGSLSDSELEELERKLRLHLSL